MSIGRTLIQGAVLPVFIALSVLGGGALWLDHARFLREPLNLAKEETVLLEAGLNQTALLQHWQEQGWLRHGRDRLWLRLRQKLLGGTSHLQKGEYLLRPGETLLAVLGRMQRGDVVIHEFTIVEGWTFAQLREALARQPALDHRSAGWGSAEIMSAIGRRDLHPEGRFLPETYAYTRGMSDLDFLARAARAMDDALEQIWSDRTPNLPLNSPDEALILASIIEKETGRADERGLIAGVFIERLRRGMRLQTDPTVIYGLGESFDGNLRLRDLRTDNPYNTYRRAGLPPTPIAMPGRDALYAAVNPEGEGALYFVARGDGSHQFSRTLKEHEQAVRRYQLQ